MDKKWLTSWMDGTFSSAGILSTSVAVLGVLEDCWKRTVICSQQMANTKLCWKEKV